MRPDLISHEFPIRNAHMRYSRDRLPIPGTDRFASPQTEILDHFTGADTTNLTAHSPDFGGAAWTQWASSITIVSNVAVVQTAIGIYVQNSHRTDGVITCKFKCGAANGNYAPSIVFRGDDANNFLYVYFSGDGNLLLQRRNGGAYQNIASTTWTADANWHTARVTFDDLVVTVQIDGGTVWSNTIANTEKRGHYHGILGFSLAGLKDSFDDFQISGVYVSPFPGQYGRVNFADDFAAADSTQLGTRTGWTEDDGDWEVQGNAAQQQTVPTAGSKGVSCTHDAGLADVAMEVKITTGTGDFCDGFAFRVQDTTHFIELEFNSHFTYSGWAGFGIWVYNGGAPFYRILNQYLVPAPSTTYTTRLRLRGALIIAEVVEANILAVGSCPLFIGATKHGLYESRPTGYSSGKFDDFVMRIQ